MSVDAGSPAVPPGAPVSDRGVADGLYHPLDPRSVAAARIAGAIGAAAVVLPALLAVLAAAIAVPLGLAGALMALAVWAAASALLAGWCYAWPGVRYRRLRYRLDRQGFTIRRGVVWRSVTSVPKSRVQHTDVSQGPLQRAFDLATLVVHTAGTQDSSVSLGGLTHGVALRIRDYLIDAGPTGGGDERGD
ncbi:MAG: PH domain-containing protein [Acidobacteria bacterium]|nr:PH domain-containing protein [Acidobacteriota bacterium]